MSYAITLNKKDFTWWIGLISILQNRAENQTQDHMTICGFMSTNLEFERHALSLCGGNIELLTEIKDKYWERTEKS